MAKLGEEIVVLAQDPTVPAAEHTVAYQRVSLRDGRSNTERGSTIQLQTRHGKVVAEGTIAESTSSLLSKAHAGHVSSFETELERDKARRNVLASSLQASILVANIVAPAAATVLELANAWAQVMAARTAEFFR